MSANLISLISGLGGAVLGAIVGGLISWILARQSSIQTLKRDQEARSQVQKGNALSLMIKASLILSDVVSIRKIIDKSLMDANSNGLTDQPLWRRVVPIVSHYQVFNIDANELSPLIEAKANEIFYNATELFAQHATLLSALEKYSTLRSAIKHKISKHEIVKDNVIVSSLTESDIAALAPYELELESLIKEIMTQIPDLQKLAESVTFSIGPAIRDYFKDSSFPCLISANGNENGSS